MQKPSNTVSFAKFVVPSFDLNQINPRALPMVIGDPLVNYPAETNLKELLISEGGFLYLGLDQFFNHMAAMNGIDVSNPVGIYELEGKISKMDWRIIWLSASLRNKRLQITKEFLDIISFKAVVLEGKGTHLLVRIVLPGSDEGEKSEKRASA